MIVENCFSPDFSGLKTQKMRWLPAVADPKILKGGTEDNLSVPSSFIANAHSDLYAFYTEKCGFLRLKKKLSRRPTAPPL